MEGIQKFLIKEKKTSNINTSNNDSTNFNPSILSNNLGSTQYSFKDSGKFLIRRNLKGILEVVLEEINEFKQHSSLKLKSLSVLLYLVKACGPLLCPYLEKILTPLYIYSDSEEEISNKCEEVSQALGLSLDQNIILPLMSKHLLDFEVKNSYAPMYSRLKLLSNVINKMANISAENTLMLINLIQSLDVFNMPADGVYTKKILYYTYSLFHSLVINLGKDLCNKYHSELFFPLLLLSSLPQTIVFHNDVRNSLIRLSEFCGFSSIEQLYSLELSCVLTKFSSSHKDWKRNSPDRFAYDTYVRNGGIALDKHWIDILMIISTCCEADRDLEMRIDMMILLEFTIDSNQLSDQIRNYTEFILPEILIPSMAWKALRPNNKIRKAALVCTIKLFKNNLIEVETGCQFFKDLLLVLKSTLEDDWDPEMRFLSISLLKYLLSYCQSAINEFNLTDVYPLILKRLDDSQDTNRILACEVFSLFFKICEKVKISDSTFEYILTSAFIHLDDPNENVRKAVLGFLLDAKKVNEDLFKQVLDRNSGAFIHKSILKEF